MDSKAITESKSTIKTKATTRKATTAISNTVTTTSKTIKKVKTRAIICDSDSSSSDTADDETMEGQVMATFESEGNTVDSFNISRGRKLSVGRFRNGDAFVDIRESHPRQKVSRGHRRGRGICLTMTQWKNILGLLPEIEKSINKITSHKRNK